MRVSVHGGSVARIVEGHLGVRVGGVRRRAELAARRRRPGVRRRVQARAGNRPAHGAAPGALAGFNRRVGVAAVRQAAERQGPRVRRQVAARLRLARARGVPARGRGRRGRIGSAACSKKTTEEDARAGGW